MNPEILWQITAERMNDARIQAQQDRSARRLVKALRAARRGGNDADELVLPTIPDYVDGSFRVDSKVGESTGLVPTARRAA
jgi:hypothetical protein